MNYTIPDDSLFIIKGQLKTKAQKSEVRESTRKLFKNNKLTVAYDPKRKVNYVKVEPKQ